MLTILVASQVLNAVVLAASNPGPGAGSSNMGAGMICFAGMQGNGGVHHVERVALVGGGERG